MSLLSRNLRTAGGKSIDPYFKQTTLLLQGDGTNGAQNNTFIDSSVNNLTITRTGNTTPGSFNPYGDRWSNYFDGTGDYLSVPDNTMFTMGSGDFTVEAWVNTGSVTATSYVLGQVDSAFVTATASFFIQISGGNIIGYVASGSTFYGALGALPINTWTHVAFVRQGGTLRLYLNGVQTGTNATISTLSINDSAQVLSIGRNGTWNAEYFRGYLSDIKITKGTALYPNGTTFSVPKTYSTASANTSLLTCQSNRFKDNSTNNFAITAAGDVKVHPTSPYAPSTEYTKSKGSSIYFDGTGDYLDTSSTAQLTIGTSDFSIEFWFYSTSTVIQNIYDQRTVQPSVTPTIYYSSGIVFFYTNNANRIQSSSVNLNEWNHIVLSRVSGTTRMFLNGVQTGVNYTDANNYLVNRVRIGTSFTPNDGLVGYLSDVRTIIGSGVSTVTVPTMPLTTVTNTRLLLAGKNAAIENAAAATNLETLGNAQINTTTKKYGIGSVYFDGTGDYLVTPYSPDMDLLPGSFTIETWVYPTVFRSGGTRIFSTGGGVVAWNATTGIHVLLQFGTSGDIQLQLSSNTTTPKSLASSGTVSLNTWTHIAAVYDATAGAIRVFINGVMTSVSVTGVLRPSTNPVMNIASIPGEAAAATVAFQGYIDDLRVTKGIARYSANFTPPTKALPLK